MADQPKSKFGGVPVDDGTASKFGGVAVSDQAKPVEPQRPGESRIAYLMRIPTHVDSSRIDAQMEADKADFRQIGEGVSSVVHANTADEAAGGASTALRGGMKIAAKALPALAPMMPVATVGGLVAGTAGSLVGQAGASAAGAGPGTSSLAGDIAGILAGGMGARLANAAAKILVHPSVLPKLIRILPKGQAMMDAATSIREAATPPVPETPGQALAKSNGMDWAKLKPDDQALLETAARAQANAAAQPAPTQRPASQPQQVPTVAQPGMTAADMLRQELGPKPPEGGRLNRETRRAASRPPETGNPGAKRPVQPPIGVNVPFRPPMAQPPAPPSFPYAPIPYEPITPTYTPPPDPLPTGWNVPLRPPMRSAADLAGVAPKAPPNVQTAPEAAAVQPPPAPPQGLAEAVAPPPARTLAQTEAAMAQKAPAPLEPPTSRYTSTGEKKSPQLRAAEITGDNAAKKAQRWAEAFRAEGVTSEDLGNMNSGDLDVFTEGMKAKNRIDPKTGIGQNETVPKTSFPLIKKRLKALELQESLRDAMSKSGTIK